MEKNNKNNKITFRCETKYGESRKNYGESETCRTDNTYSTADKVIISLMAALYIGLSISAYSTEDRQISPNEHKQSIEDIAPYATDAMRR